MRRMPIAVATVLLLIAPFAYAAQPVVGLHPVANNRVVTPRPAMTLPVADNATISLDNFDQPLQVGELRFTGPTSAVLVVSRTSPGTMTLMKACANGKHIPQAKLVCRQQQQPYLVVTMNNVLVSSYSAGASARGGGPRSYQSFMLNFTNVQGPTTGFRDPSYTP